MKTHDSSRSIRLLREDVSRRIAAGEVIDRPFSVLRELLDNCIDAHAKSIDVSLKGGGIDEIRVRDDGFGMPPDDLELCIEPHATSKITEIEDLARITSLGFRGEALSAIAAAGKLEITSSDGDHEAHRIVVHGGKIIRNGAAAGGRGTTVLVNDLFYTMPARRKFLSRPSAETTRCRNMVIEKSLPFPETSFQFTVDGEIKLTLPRCEDRSERIYAAYASQLPHDSLYEGHVSTSSAEIDVYASDPSFSRKDRKLMQIFVNNRSVDDFGLLQAIQYAYGPFLPGGLFPAAFVFIRIDPKEIDFNIHPAKKEIRFASKREIHHTVLEAVRDATRSFSGEVIPVTEPEPEFRRSAETYLGFDVGESPQPYHNSRKAFRKPSFTEYEKALPRRDVPQTEPNEDIRYHGQIFNLFLLVERGDRLFIIDQHAAHERILFEKLREKPGEVQSLLVPRKIDTDELSDAFLESTASELLAMGIEMSSEGEEGWFLKSVPAAYRGMEQAIVAFIESWRGDRENLERELYAMYACRSAVKDNDVLDPVTARELAEKALALTEPRCPHGRPIWYEISRESLFQRVGRV